MTKIDKKSELQASQEKKSGEMMDISVKTTQKCIFTRQLHRLRRRRYRPAHPSAFGFGFRRSDIVTGRKAPCGADEIA